MPDGTGLVNHSVFFIPEAAKRADTYRDARSTDATLVIDYELLAALPAQSGVPPSPQAASPDVPQATTKGKEEPSQKDADIEALRKELQDIKRQLAEQEAERRAQQKKSNAPK